MFDAAASCPGSRAGAVPPSVLEHLLLAGIIRHIREHGGDLRRVLAAPRAPVVVLDEALRQCPSAEPAEAEVEPPEAGASSAPAARVGWATPLEAIEGLDGPASPEPLRQLLDQAESTTGIALGRLLDRLDMAELDSGDVVDVVALWGKVAAYAQARQADAAALVEQRLEDLYGPPALPQPSGDPRIGPPIPTAPSHPAASSSSGVPRAATELAMRLAITRQAAGKLIRTGRMLAGPMAATSEAVETGELSFAKAEVMATHLEELPEPLVLEVEEAVLPTAPGSTSPKLAKDLTTAIAAIDPQGADQRHAAARSRRRVNHARALPDGMASISAYLPAEGAVALDAALDAAARTARADGDRRTTDQLRADILAGIGFDALTTGWIGAPAVQSTLSRPDAPGATATADQACLPGAPPKSGETGEAGEVGEADESGRADAAGATGRAAGWPVRSLGGAPVRLNVTMPISTLLGGSEPAELDGYGAISAPVARALATDSTIRRILTDPASGTVVDLGRTTYRPPAALARLVRERDRTCVRPGCGVRAQACDLDHTIPFGPGPTALGNLGALCSTDHRHKSLGHFAVTQHQGGVFDWTSPTGHTYRRQANGTIVHLGHRRHRSSESEPPPERPAPHDPGDGSPHDPDLYGEPPF
ncbi:HNH endonuclease signature motif containing protein [Georgenia alba]|uniref:DUF222 domain-containing protein n=1 Tax=Georgenia alba TaxID=2233858 RepID=A0ABW2QFE6_9MICO